MTNTEKQSINKIQAVLTSIDNGTPLFFNVVQYENMGLVTSKKKWTTDAIGNKVDCGYTFHLTEKARKFLSVTV